ncbi:hypothetical protein R6G99_10270, partial [Actinotignum timonense]|nr:hypothetical protein [Actinotignum timonense]
MRKSGTVSKSGEAAGGIAGAGAIAGVSAITGAGFSFDAAGFAHLEMGGAARDGAIDFVAQQGEGSGKCAGIGEVQGLAS